MALFPMQRLSFLAPLKLHLTPFPSRHFISTSPLLLHSISSPLHLHFISLHFMHETQRKDILVHEFYKRRNRKRRMVRSFVLATNFEGASNLSSSSFFLNFKLVCKEKTMTYQLMLTSMNKIFLLVEYVCFAYVFSFINYANSKWFS